MGRFVIAPRKSAPHFGERRRVATLWATLVVLAFAGPSRAHDPRLDLPDPQSAPECWDAIRQSTDNIGKLLETNQLKDIVRQVANCSTSIQFLSAHPGDDPDPKRLREMLENLFQCGTGIILATRQPSAPLAETRRRYLQWQQAEHEVAARYKPDVVKAAVYVCPMHPRDRHLSLDDRCSQCGMQLIKRRVISSDVYEVPGQPSMTLTPEMPAPLHVGRPSNLPFKLARKDGTPVGHADLLVMHTRKIHLLIVDRSLSDYHHEHPEPADKPGEYTFSFTPRKPGPYRVFADVVPAATGVQEYIIADLPGDEAPGKIDDTATRLSTTVDGFGFKLAFLDQHGPSPTLIAGQPVSGRITVTGPNGKGFTGLEPVMGAFAHIVGFSEDGKTVVHIHPIGQEPTQPQDRGGPSFDFKVYPPVPGFYRLYGQVRIGGQSRFAPFAVVVAPGALSPPAVRDGTPAALQDAASSP